MLCLSSLLIAGGSQLPFGQGIVEREPFRVITVEDDPLPQRTVNDADCTYLQDPLRYAESEEVRDAKRTAQINGVIRWTLSLDGTSTGLTDASSIHRNNFVDDEIFTRMASANIKSAPLTSDAEFLRRVYLDLTGRIPSATDVTTFLANTASNKRDTTIDALLASPEFTDKWTMFFGDLFQNNVTSTQVQRGVQGRDAFYLYLKNAIAGNQAYDAIARELITAAGDSFSVGQANWPVGNTISMGPVQDTYDGAAVDLGNMFMGISAVDCLLCHDGAHHLDQVNLWGATQTRQNLWGLAAYFSRTTMARAQTGGTLVSDNTTGVYRLNTNSGNRVPRQPIGTVTTITPRYPFGTAVNPGSGIAAGETYRAAIARQITGDVQFSRAGVNYIWEKLMGQAFVSPSNGFDLARLDPNNPPPAPWTLQPTNPQLLNRLATFFQANGYNLRLLIGTIVKSSAYQLSSTYNGEWQANYVPYYARKYVRRLDAEEILDAVTKATGVTQTYAFTGSTLPPVQWAMQMPDTREPTLGGTSTTPTSTGNVTAFLNAFGRGDRDINPRRFDGTVLQGLTAMNSPFIQVRMHRTNTTSRVAALLAQTPNDPSNLIRQLYLSTLSRPATDDEVNGLLPTFQQQQSQTTGYAPPLEDLQWVLLNRVQFLFNY